jgi:hypothetical protein
MKKFIYDLEKKIKDRLILYLAILFILAIIGIIF